MSAFPVGCYVMHKKLLELGSGEVVMVDKGEIRIRFASGERNFLAAYVDSHLEVTADAPVAAATTLARKRAARPSKKKAAAAASAAKQASNTTASD